MASSSEPLTKGTPSSVATAIYDAVVLVVSAWRLVPDCVLHRMTKVGGLRNGKLHRD
jgi:hypothetical protein